MFRKQYNILSSFLEESKQGGYQSGIEQYQFCCPCCAEDNGGKLDGKYNLETAGSAYIIDKMIRNYGGTYAEEVVEYTITAYTIGKTVAERNIINSNPCSSIVTTTARSILAPISVTTISAVS